MASTSGAGTGRRPPGSALNGASRDVVPPGSSESERGPRVDVGGEAVGITAVAAP